MTCGIICRREWTEEDTRALLAPPYPGEFDDKRDWIDKALQLTLAVILIGSLPVSILVGVLVAVLGD